MYHIAYITDENYVLPTKVSIASLVDAVGDAEVTIHVILDNVAEASRKQLLDLQTANVRMRLFDELPSLDGINATHAYISRAAFLKFFIGDIIRDVDIILFVDGDTLLFKGFLSIFDTDISKVYAAVVPDMVAMRKLDCHIELGLQSYFNSGVMLLNLDRIRKEGISRKLVKDMGTRKNVRFMDQDSLNAVFDGNVIQKSIAYNCIDSCIMQYPQDEILQFYGARPEELSSPFIRHITGSGNKPWKAPGAYKLGEWLGRIGEQDYLEITKRYFEAIARDLDVKAAKFIGSAARPYHPGFDMLQTSTDGVKLDGFFKEEPWGRWCGRSASILVSGEDIIKTQGELCLSLKVRAFHVERPLRLTFNGAVLCDLIVPCDKSILPVFPISASMIRRTNLIEIVSGGETILPKDLGKNFDSRPLFLGFGIIRIVESLGKRFASEEKALAAHSAELAAHSAELAAHGEIIAKMRKSVDDAHAGLRIALGEIEAIRNSASFRLGRALTFIPRKVKKLFR